MKGLKAKADPVVGDVAEGRVAAGQGQGGAGHGGQGQGGQDQAGEAGTEPCPGELSHNLLGQRLGRKGRGTRERILAATERLLAGPPEQPISLSAVAREASLGMTTLYLYFGDLTELLIAVLEPIMAEAEATYVETLREHWPDDQLAERALRYVTEYYGFWERHSRILHLRNSLADASDKRMAAFRIESTAPLIADLVHQMHGVPGEISPQTATATLLFTGVERVITIATDHQYISAWTYKASERVPSLLQAAARLMELGIRDVRAQTTQ